MTELISGTIEEAATAATRAPGTAKKKARPVAASVKKADGKRKKASNPAPSAKGPGATKAKGARQGSKTDKIITLLKQPHGASLKEIMKATGWQAHSVRGFIATLGKTINIESFKTEQGVRTYKTLQTGRKKGR